MLLPEQSHSGFPKCLPISPPHAHHAQNRDLMFVLIGDIEHEVIVDGHYADVTGLTFRRVVSPISLGHHVKRGDRLFKARKLRECILLGSKLERDVAENLEKVVLRPLCQHYRVIHDPIPRRTLSNASFTGTQRPACISSQPFSSSASS